VVDLSSGIAGAYCTKLLAEGGADVVKVESPDGDPLRRWSASQATIPPGDDGALFSFLACSKHSVIAHPDRRDDIDFVARLLDSADAVVWSRGSRLAEHPRLSPAELLRAHPHLTVTSITPFGLDGPWRDRPATEFTVQAWSGGIVGLGRGSPARAPVFVGGQVGEWLSGVYAAIGTMVSRARALETDSGELVDVSMLEALVLCLTYYPVTFFDIVGRPFRAGRLVLRPGVEAARDGLVGLGVGTGQQWLDFCVMVRHPEWMDDPSLFANRAHLAPLIEEWVAAHTVDEVLEEAKAFRIPHAPIGNGATIPSTDHFQVRRSLAKNPRDGFDQPDSPCRFEPPVLEHPQPAPRLGEHTARYRSEPPRARMASDGHAPRELPLSGVRVLDLTAFWAGPLCSHVIAMLGAEVIHVESTSRPDGTRAAQGGVPLTDEMWWEKSGIFSALNTNKKSVTLDLGTERGRDLLKQLVTTCDVLVENFTPRVLDQIGLDFDSARALRPDIVMVRMPGFGLDGPWRDNAAFAFVIEDAAGLTWMTGNRDALPLSPYCIGDPNAGTHAVAGLLLALEHRRHTGEGVLVEAAMVDSSLSIAAEQVIEYSAYGNLLERDGNRGPTSAPQNVYLAADVDGSGVEDCWVAIAIATDEQWIALQNAIGQPDWVMNPNLSTAAGRRCHQDLIDEQLAAWCRDRAADDIVGRLWDAGVPVGKVMQPHHQGELPQLAFRGFFEDLDHPVTGRARYATLPIRFSRGPARFHRRHAPLLGEHSSAVLAELGIGNAELASLEADGVTGRAPLTAASTRAGR
jgi:crotonobetainyl-CoA:carnitine CoA-transferase CaiB-like acyl-CoA transferase